MRLLLALIALTAGAALAAPAPVLRLTSGATVLDLPIPPDGTYGYGYRQSIYGVPVVETERVVDGRITVVRARSSDRRSLEYYRWGDDIRRVGAEFVQEAPPASMDELAIRITDAGEQWLEADGVRVVLLTRFGDTAIRVAPASMPRAVWLAAHFAR